MILPSATGSLRAACAPRSSGPTGTSWAQPRVKSACRNCSGCCNPSPPGGPQRPDLDQHAHTRISQMKLASYEHAGKASYGVVKDGGIVDLGGRLAASGFATLRQFLAAGDRSAARDLAASKGADVALSDVILSPVIPDP